MAQGQREDRQAVHQDELQLGDHDARQQQHPLEAQDGTDLEPSPDGYTSRGLRS